NTGTKHSYPMGTSLHEISQHLNIRLKQRVCGAIVNHQARELSFCVVKPKQIEFYDVTHPDGIRMYIRSLIFILYVATKEVYPHVSLRIRKGISNGYFCEFSNMGREIDENDIEVVKNKMKDIIAADEPFVKERLLTEEAVKHLINEGLVEKAQLFDQRGHLYSSLYFLNKLGNY